MSDMETPLYYVSSGFIKRTGSGTRSDPNIFTEMTDKSFGSHSGERGIPSISWFAAARFANWLHNGAMPGASTEDGAYKMSPCPYATFDQAGLLWEWTEGIFSLNVGPNRIVRGGSYSFGLTPVKKTIRRDYEPGFYRDDDTGFRVATA